MVSAQKTNPASSNLDPNKRRLFMVDEHPIVRRGLAELINEERDLIVCGQGEDAYGSLRQIRELKPDLVLLDVSLKDSDGIQLLGELQAQLPNLPVLMLSMHEESLYAERALRAGARGYIMKQEPATSLLHAIRTVLNGQVYVSEKMGATLLNRMVGGKKSAATLPMDRLTDRELEVFRLIGGGETEKEIADRLCLSTKTVEAHREHIKDKLGFKTSAQLVRFAIMNSPEGQQQQRQTSSPSAAVPPEPAAPTKRSREKSKPRSKGA
jgi:DNA-binding NarL/FixJ family response regulator